jgi:hypothetical protein
MDISIGQLQVVLALPSRMGWLKEKNRHLLEITRCIMVAMNVPKYFWSEAVM